MKYNIKCILGASVLTPVIVGIIVFIFYSFIHLCYKFPNIIFGIMMTITGIFILLISIALWGTLYEHCQRHWINKKLYKGGS